MFYFPSNTPNFNPRSREGSDMKTAYFWCCKTISIHAPAKGATSMQQALQQGGLIFQSTLPRRERRTSQSAVSSQLLFQSTLPRRERQRCLFHAGTPDGHFNPRSREGSDSEALLAPQVSDISIHAPAKGATAESLVCARLSAFQSTLPRRERHYAVRETP